MRLLKGWKVLGVVRLKGFKIAISIDMLKLTLFNFQLAICNLQLTSLNNFNS
jgi:hypothetical protein